VPNSTALPADLAVIKGRTRAARRAVAWIGYSCPVYAAECARLRDSLADIPVLASQVACLRDDIAAVRLLRANLAAAGRASIAADLGGEPDPLSYLRDELADQGYPVPGRPR
jgi:hypothetical protein